MTWRREKALEESDLGESHRDPDSPQLSSNSHPGTHGFGRQAMAKTKEHRKEKLMQRLRSFKERVQI